MRIKEAKSVNTWNILNVLKEGEVAESRKVSNVNIAKHDAAPIEAKEELQPPFWLLTEPLSTSTHNAR